MFGKQNKNKKRNKNENVNENYKSNGDYNTCAKITVFFISWDSILIIQSKINCDENYHL